jgi:sortase A
MNGPDEQTKEPATRDRGRRRSPARRLARAAGALSVVVALVLLASVAWELWGTGIATARDQRRLGQQFNAAVQSHLTVPAGTTGTSTPPSTISSSPSLSPAADVVPGPTSTQPTMPSGTVVAHLVIPKIGVNYYVVEGVGGSQLAEGPGHYPGTALPGGAGNVGIAGHRTTHGAPFYNLNELQPGDQVFLTNTAGQTFTYRVTTQFVVAPSDGAVLNPTPTPTLTLTTCNPRYSASQRLIVRAALVTNS